MVLYSLTDAPDLSGKVIIITGSSSGIGLEAARILVKSCSAHVVLACRNLQKARPFLDELNNAGPGKATLLQIDTSDLASVRAFAAAFLALNLNRLDRLVLNAGIMAVPFSTVPVASGVAESQFATNHLGHFLLTALLLPTILSTPGARIVSVSSIAAYYQKDMDYAVARGETEESYSTFTAYGISKLSNLLFTRELQARLKAAGVDTLALAAHPGYSRTALQDEFSKGWFGALEGFFIRRFASQPQEKGAEPLVLACIDAQVSQGDGAYYAPSGFWEMTGTAKSTANVPVHVTDEKAKELWRVSEEMVGQSFSL